MSARWLLPLVLLLVASGCKTLPVARSVGYGAPDPKATLEDVPVRGATVRVEAEFVTYRGELLSVEEKLLWVLVPDSGEVSVPRHELKQVVVEVRPSTVGRDASWTLLGAISTVSHGLFALFSAPLWLLTGTTSTLMNASSTSITLKPEGLATLWQYARFPQGRPQAQPPAPAAQPEQAPEPAQPESVQP